MSSPHLAIVVFRTGEKEYTFRAFSFDTPNHSQSLVSAVHQFIGYSDETPWNTHTPFGEFRELWMRSCSLPLAEREGGVRFRYDPLKGVRWLIRRETNESLLEDEHVAEHVTLF